MVMKNVQTARNYCFLTPVDSAPPEEIAVETPRLEGGQQTLHESNNNLLHKGGEEDSDMRKVIP